jgi:hypothetical protein
MPEKYTIYDISAGYIFKDYEQLGTKEKHWVIDAQGKKFLFKLGRPGTGENWAEVVACNIAKELGLPHANYFLAVENGKFGSLSNSFVPDDGRLIHGNELLFDVSVDAEVRRKKASMKNHLLSSVRAVTKILNNKPTSWNSINGIKTAEDVFCGYLMLDALIANQDRHYENWGYILTRDQTVHLAPTFDHASSLGRNETEITMQDRLTTKDIGRSMQKYVEKARPSLYASRHDTKALGTLDAFVKWGEGTPNAAKAWIDQLAAISENRIRNIIEMVPNEMISPIAAEFTTTILLLNRKRILEAGKLFI